MTIYLPLWEKLGRDAGPIRNGYIINDATHVLAFPSKTCRGTRDSINKAKKKGCVLMVVEWDKDL